ncbi:polymorphic toxin-type HINT domain-containing protein, partial [Deinococcus roseus]|uniref:polymorphic toxin-type HINT domain-containing protein n=1 Tax=Deinococcus roseus TaxID=392414 RepID=UPI001E5FED42
FYVTERSDAEPRPKPEGHSDLSDKWVGAGHLKVGDKLKQADGTLGEVRYVNTIQEARTMYNLEVQEAHTFFVGTQGWLVHNCPEGDEVTKVINWRSTPQFGHTFSTHGAGTKNTKSLIDRARGTGNDQGQWLDNEAASKYLGGLGEIKEVITVEIPRGLGQVIKPNGEIVTATHALIVPSKTGIKTAYPYIPGE